MGEADTMRVVEIPEYGESDVLRVAARERPTPDPGELVIETRAIGVNFADIKRRRGASHRAPDPPFVPGLEAAGEIVMVGKGVEHAVGDRVVAFVGAGGYAEYVLASAKSTFAIPDSMSFEEGAAFPVQYLTAHNCLHEWGGLAVGESVLVHAAAGGVGTAAVQLAATAGAEVFATASTTEKLQYADSLGADHCIDYTEEDVEAELNRLTEDGVDLVVDGVGGEAFEASQAAIAPFGRIVVIGSASGTEGRPDPAWLRVRNASVIGYHLGTAMERRPERIRSAAEHLYDLFDDGRLEVVVGETFALADVARAHDRIEHRESTGKVLLVP
jgi:NADPH2:quinone reductase